MPIRLGHHPQTLQTEPHTRHDEHVLEDRQNDEILCTPHISLDHDFPLSSLTSTNASLQCLIFELKQKIKKLNNKSHKIKHLGIDRTLKTDKKVKFRTGLPNKKNLDFLCKTLEPKLKKNNLLERTEQALSEM